MSTAAEGAAAVATGGPKADDAPVGEAAAVNPSLKTGIDESSAIEVKDDKKAEAAAEDVKAPGVLERAREEVEAAAEALQEKLNLKEGGEEEEQDALNKEKKGKDHKEEQAGVFKRLLKKLGWGK